MIDKDGIKVFKCDKCGYNFKPMTWVKQHMTKKHRTQKMTRTTKKKRKQGWTKNSSLDLKKT